MKKLIVGLLASFLIASGLVAFTGSPSTAACPYTGCIATNSNISGPGAVRQNTAPTFKISVTPRAGNARVRGSVKITVARKGGGFKNTRTTSYTGSRKSVKGPRLRKTGRYTVTMVFTPARNSVYRASKDSYSLKVVKRRR
ncbi:hypothetical protein [Nocardioides lijunqiniae]|uniref:hypothetical protein n=1 Tax=Nocardioides lijunqiniae TaxID=2760832 RepID=UPI001878D457|nr:hypothetical protein [Nocardioides lijunqiniae]